MLENANSFTTKSIQIFLKIQHGLLNNLVFKFQDLIYGHQPQNTQRNVIAEEMLQRQLVQEYELVKILPIKRCNPQNPGRKTRKEVFFDEGGG